jgi:hypothetical protein
MHSPVIHCRKDSKTSVQTRLGYTWEYGTLFYYHKKFEVINTLSLTRMGSIHVKEVTYLDKEKSKQRLEKNLSKLRPGLLKS